MIWFWCDTHAAVGLGHLVRCLAIAQQVPADHSLRFVVSERWPGLDRFLSSYSFDVVVGGLGDVGAAADDVIIADGYDIDLELLERSEARTVLLDDLGERDPTVDLIVNPNVYAPSLTYTSEALLGSTYALLRADFLVARDHRPSPRPKVGRVFVMMGGTDPTGESARVLEALSAVGFTGQVDLVTARDDLQPPDYPYSLTIHRSIASPSTLMCEADIAFCAAGGSTWELACIGVPAIQVVVAENQREIGKWLRAQGLGIVFDGPTEIADLAGAFTSLAPESVRRSHSDKARELLDGRGAARVAQASVGG